METTPSIGLIGLGIMGRPMARNLLRAGYPLVVHDVTAPAVDELVADGATAGHLAARGGRGDRRPDHDAPRLAPGARGLPRPRRRVRGAATGLAGDRHELDRAQHRARARRPGGGGRRGDARRPGERRRQGRDRGNALDHGRRDGGGLRAGPANSLGDGQDDRPRRARGRRPGREGLQPGRRRRRDRGGVRGPRAGRQGGRRSRPDRRRPPGRPRLNEGPRTAPREHARRATSIPGFRIRLHQKDLKNALELGARDRRRPARRGQVEQLMRAMAAAGRADYDHSGLVTVLEDLAGLPRRRRGGQERERPA